MMQVRPFKLETDDQLRKLDPNDIDRMVSIKGMVTRTSQARSPPELAAAGGAQGRGARTTLRM